MSANLLSEAEEERLIMLAEEAAEVIQVVGKILRYGYDSYHPDDPPVTNKKHLHEELLDISAALGEMNKRGDIKFQATEKEVAERWNKKLRWTRHQI